MNGDTGQTGHAIVGGFGHLGSRIAARLREKGKDVVIVDRDLDESMRAAAIKLGCEVISGNITDDDLLEAAGIHTASCFLAVTGDDSTNLESAISARQMNEGLSVVLRLSDQSLARRVDAVFDVVPLNPGAIASPAFVSAASDDPIVAMIDIEDDLLSIYRAQGVCRSTLFSHGVFVGKKGSHLFITNDHQTAETSDDCFHVVVQNATASRQSVKARLHKQKSGLFAVKWMKPKQTWQWIITQWQTLTPVTRSLFTTLTGVGLLSVIVFSLIGKMSLLDALYFVVTTMTTVGYGDINLQNAPVGLKIYGIIMMLSGAALLATVYAIIADRFLTARIEHLLGRRGVKVDNHTIVVGLGNVGYRIAYDLHALGEEVVAVERCEDSDKTHAARQIMHVVIGDAMRPSILEIAGIDTAKTLIAATDDSVVNLSIALHARARNPEIRIIARTYEYNLADKFRKLNLDHVLSTSAIAAPTFVDNALNPTVLSSFKCGKEDILVMRHSVDSQSPLAGRTANKISEDLDIAVVAVKSMDSSHFEAVKPETIITHNSMTIILIAR